MLDRVSPSQTAIVLRISDSGLLAACPHPVEALPNSECVHFGLGVYAPQFPPLFSKQSSGQQATSHVRINALDQYLLELRQTCF